MNRVLKVLLLLAMTATSNVNAGLISDYTLNGNIVKNDARNIEWLQWTETDGMSINEALGIYQSQGWELATQQNMADLFNDFDLSYGTFIWDTDENTVQSYISGSDGSTEAADDRELKFVSLFGDTFEEYHSNDGYCGSPNSDCLQFSGAYFGSDEDNNGQYNSVGVHDDYGYGATWENQEYQGENYMGSGIFSRDVALGEYGSALVRTTEVSEPHIGAIFSLALLGLMARRRKR